MNKQFILILLLHLMLTASKCKTPLVDKFYTITVINNSVDSICVFFADKNSVVQYPDTVLPVQKPALQTIRPTRSKYHDSREPWSKEFSYLKGDTLSIYIIDSRVYKDSSWFDIRETNKILLRYDLSYEDLKMLNYNVHYPPKQEMKDIKMWP